VNEAFGRRYWPGRDGLGRQLRRSGDAGPPVDVVGVVRDGKYFTLGEDPRPFVFRRCSRSTAPPPWWRALPETRARRWRARAASWPRSIRRLPVFDAP
jgi:hypothetical protein